MKRDLLDMITGYLMGWRTLRDCLEWLASIDWYGPDVDAALKEIAGQLELLGTEVLENMRPEEEFREYCAKFVGDETPTWYNIPFEPSTIVITSTTADVSTTPLLGLTAEVGGPERPWNISLQPVSS